MGLRVIPKSEYRRLTENVLIKLLSNARDKPVKGARKKAGVLLSTLLHCLRTIREREKIS